MKKSHFVFTLILVLIFVNTVFEPQVFGDTEDTVHGSTRVIQVEGFDINDFVNRPNSIEVTGPDSIEVPNSGTALYQYQAIVKDMYGNIMEDEVVTWQLIGGVGRASIGTDGVISLNAGTEPGFLLTIRAVSDTDNTVIGGKTIATKAVSSNGMTIKINGSKNIIIPSIGTKKYMYSATVKNSSGAALAFEPVEWSIEGMMTGLYFDQAIGELTVDSSAPSLKETGQFTTINAKMASNYSVKTSFLINLQRAVPSAIEITGNPILNIPARGTLSSNYSAIVKDQEGAPIDGSAVVWSIVEDNVPAAVDPSSGIVTVNNATTGTTFTLKAVSSEKAEVLSTKSISIIADSCLDKSGDSFDKSADKQKDVAVSLTLRGNTVSAIKNGNSTLTPGTHYSVSGNQVTIYKSYLSGLPIGTASLTFDFSDGTDPVLNISVTDSSSGTGTPPPAGGDIPGLPLGGGIFLPPIADENSAPPAEPVNGVITVSAAPGKDGESVSEINQAELTKAFSQIKADETGKKTIVIDIKKADGAVVYTQKLPSNAFSSDGEGRDMLLKTPAGSLLIPAEMFKESELKNISGVGISVGIADKSKVGAELADQIGQRPLIELSASFDGKKTEWNNPEAPVTVSVDYKPTAGELADLEHIVVWYIDGAGKVHSIPNGRYDPNTGKVTFKTSHFSLYAVSYVKKSFDDISGTAVKKKIEVMASKGIIAGKSEKAYGPFESITRADFITLLVRVLELNMPTESNFSDIRPGAYYYDAVVAAKKAGITTGTGDNRFEPNKPISRQDMMVMVARAIKITQRVGKSSKAELKQYNDYSDIAGYARDSISFLVVERILMDNSNILRPRDNATREEMAEIIYNIYYRIN